MVLRAGNCFLFWVSNLCSFCFSFFFSQFDLSARLFLTSIMHLFSLTVRLPLAMAVCGAYIVAILLLNPMMRHRDDQMLLLAEAEILLLLLSAFVVQTLGSVSLDYTSDVLLSLLLIALTLAVFAAFLRHLVMYLRSVY